MLDLTATMSHLAAVDAAYTECSVHARLRRPGHDTDGFVAGVRVAHEAILDEIANPDRPATREHCAWGHHGDNRAHWAMETLSTLEMTRGLQPGSDEEDAWYRGFSTGTSQMRWRFVEA